MSNKDSLIGKSVSLYLDGGWEVNGEIKSADDDKFVIEKDGDLFMVFKNKISCLLISEKARVLKAAKAYMNKDSGENKVASRNKSVPTLDDNLFPMNGMSYDESAMSIPGGLLEDAPDDSDNDFSVFFSGKDSPDKVAENSYIKFRTEDDTTDQD
jgi:sRNA-binding regulator protein Hfq